MPSPDSCSDATKPFGLCANCVHAKLIESSKGSQFLLCQLSQSDPSFPKYPRLPMLTCNGYAPNPAA
jgi:hypothetical protein